MVVQFDEEKQNQKIEELHKQEEERLAKTLSKKHGFPYVDMAPVSVNQDSLRVVDEKVAREALLGPFNIIDKKVFIACLSPKNQKTKEVLDQLKEKGYEVAVYMSSRKSLEKVWGRYKDLSFSFRTKSGALDISNDEITEIIDKTKSLDDVKSFVEEVMSMDTQYKISRLLETVLAGSLALKASDVHIEPEESMVRIRYRLDGVLTDLINIDNKTYKLVLSRIKLLSGLKLNIKDVPQDGRFSIKIKDNDIEIRTSALPGAYNESIVLRILNPNAISVSIDKLGMPENLYKIVERETSKPNGMILTTGPTGSGKTTTLYALLKKLHKPGIKIITIENPIEYHLPGIVQTQTDQKKGYTFAKGLRSALRQDPDIIMVGEIRDAETAEIAINAALTGHLVFSTLHTNDAFGAFPRLIDLDINPKVISSAINMAMAQRLLRKLCPKCRKEILLEGENKKEITKILETIPEQKRAGIQTDKIYEAVGCEHCNFTGYKGRIGIYEAVLTDAKIESVINQNPSSRQIREASLDQGIMDMKQDGIIKILEGITTLNELKRVVDLN